MCLAIDFVFISFSYFWQWLESAGARQGDENMGDAEMCYEAKYIDIEYFCDGARCLGPSCCVDIGDTNQLQFKTKVTLMKRPKCEPYLIAFRANKGQIIKIPPSRKGIR